MLYSVEFTDDIKQGFDGVTFMWFIKIRPSRRYDKGLLEHEKVHVKQFWSNPLAHGLRYQFSKSYRLTCELEAYRKQLQYSDLDDFVRHRILYATFIASKYRLDLSPTEALRLL